MHRPPLVVGFALLLVLAGCVGPLGDGSPTTELPADSGATASDRPTPTPPLNLSADNPFGQAVVPVRVNDTVDDGRNTTALVATAIDYWNGRVQRYTPFDYRFVLAEDPANARIEVRFVEEIRECGRDHDTRTVGCAPLLEQGKIAPDVAVARVEVHGSNSAVVGTVQHEMGHILGLGHDDEPHLVMGYGLETPVKDASDRAVPWHTNELSVYVDHESLDGDRQVIRDQIGHALQYYNDAASGTIPTNVSFTRTDHKQSAEVVITSSDEYDCGDISGGSTMMTKGYRGTDTDPAFEIYTKIVICLNVDEEAVGWHVGHWLGKGMGLAGDELAPPLRDDGTRDSRSDWWN